MARRTAQTLTPQVARRTPLEIMCQVAEYFLVKAEEYDTKVSAAIDADADRTDIIALMDIAAQHRIRAATVAEKAAPYCSPKLSAVELAPMTEPTVSKFESAISEMDERKVLAYLDRIKSGTMKLEYLEADADVAA